jgi:hypothetical protein
MMRLIDRHPLFIVLFCSTVIPAALFDVRKAHSGPCTAQIIKFNQQVSAIKPGPESGPTAPQTVGAQLHHQPTPGDVVHAEHVANKDADAALAQARKADAEGNTTACKAALAEARRLYGITR